MSPVSRPIGPASLATRVCDLPTPGRIVDERRGGQGQQSEVERDGKKAAGQRAGAEEGVRSTEDAVPSTEHRGPGYCVLCTAYCVPSMTPCFSPCLPRRAAAALYSTPPRRCTIHASATTPGVRSMRW